MRPTLHQNLRHAALVLLVAFAGPAPAGTAEDPAELARTWEGARVWLPDAPTKATGIKALNDAESRAIVLYAHGCDGLSRITDETAGFLARAGLLVIAPDSFSRAEKPVSCIPGRQEGSLHRRVLAWRQAELTHALEHLHTILALRDLPVVLMGHSEGGITVATWTGPPVAARIVEGWTCHAGWPEYRGLNAPQDEPVLTLVGEADPWFRLPVLQGDCGTFMAGHAGAQSVVYRAPHYLHRRHWLSHDSKVQTTILDFIAASLPKP
jgi:dienelactone hydrolase